MQFNAYYMSQYFGVVSAPSRSVAIDFVADSILELDGGPAWRPSIVVREILPEQGFPGRGEALARRSVEEDAGIY